MRKIDPKKIFIKYRNESINKEPIQYRKYTLTHSDDTGEVSLVIDKKFAYDKFSDTRDEVLAEWKKEGESYVLDVYLFIDGYGLEHTTKIRYNIFRKETPFALKTLNYGDKEFLEKNSQLKDYPIIVHFISANPNYSGIEYWGKLKDYS